MQIRELNLKELQNAYEVVKQLRTDLSYDEYEDLIYDMRHIEYKMFGIFDKGRLVTYAGASVSTNLYHKRHLFIYELVTDENFRGKNNGKNMMEYLNDYAKLAMCENIVLSCAFIREDTHRFYENLGFDKKSYIFLKSI